MIEIYNARENRKKNECRYNETSGVKHKTSKRPDRLEGGKERGW